MLLFIITEVRFRVYPKYIISVFFCSGSRRSRFCSSLEHGEKKFGIKGRVLLGVSQGRSDLQGLQETQAMFARSLALFA